MDASTVPDAAQCVGCAYSLRGLTGRRCPECGRPFDPDDPRSLGFGRQPGWFARRWIASNATPTLAWAGVTVFTTAALTGLIDPGATGSARLALLQIGVAAGMLAREPSRAASLRRHPALAPPRHLSGRTRRQLWLALALLSVGATFHTYSCPHGTRAGVLGVGLAHSINGGPCSNDPQLASSTRLFGDWYLCW